MHCGTSVNPPCIRGKIIKEGLINKENKVITLLGESCLEIITFPPYVPMLLTMKALETFLFISDIFFRSLFWGFIRLFPLPFPARKLTTRLPMTRTRDFGEIYNIFAILGPQPFLFLA
jgi:hypothetical protein